MTDEKKSSNTSESPLVQAGSPAQHDSTGPYAVIDYMSGYIRPETAGPDFLAKKRTIEKLIARRLLPVAPAGLIASFHRGQDGYIAFSRINPETEEWEDCFSLQASHIQPIFPEFVQELQDDGRFSVHGMYRPGAYPSDHKLSEHALSLVPKYYETKYKACLPASYREAAAVRYLNCCFADLDFYVKGLPAGMVLGAVKHLQDLCEIPPVTAVSFAKGAWVYWLLMDSVNPYSPPRYGGIAGWESGQIWRRIQQEICRRLEALGADPQSATNLTAMARIPGSKHGETQQGVEY